MFLNLRLFVKCWFKLEGSFDNMRSIPCCFFCWLHCSIDGRFFVLNEVECVSLKNILCTFSGSNLGSHEEDWMKPSSATLK